MGEEISVDLIVRAVAEGFGKIANEEKAIGTEAEKAAAKGKSAFEKMGEASQALNKGFAIASKGIGAVGDNIGKAFDFAAEKAERLGRSDVTDSIKEMDESLLQVTDTLAEFSIAGVDFLDVMGAAAEGATNLSKVVQISSIAFGQWSGAMSDSEAIMKANLLLLGPVVLSAEQLAQAQKDLVDPLDETNRGLRDQVTAEEAAFTASQLATQAAYDKQVALDTLIGTASDLKFGMGELTTATLYNAAAAGLSDEAAYELAVKMGLIDDAAAGAKTVLDELRTKLEEGKISTGEYTTSVGLLDAAIRSMPSGQTITIEIFEQYRQQYIQDFNAENSGQGGTESGQVGGAQGDGYATGTPGIMTVPPGHGGDSFGIRMKSNEQYAVSPPGVSLREWIGGGGGGTINNFYITNPDPRAVAMEVSHILGAQADARMRI